MAMHRQNIVRHLWDKAEQAHQQQLHAPKREVIDASSEARTSPPPLQYPLTIVDEKPWRGITPA